MVDVDGLDRSRMLFVRDSDDVVVEDFDDLPNARSTWHERAITDCARWIFEEDAISVAKDAIHGTSCIVQGRLTHFRNIGAVDRLVPNSEKATMQSFDELVIAVWCWFSRVYELAVEKAAWQRWSSAVGQLPRRKTGACMYR